jgi:hypothetical protein
MVSEEVSTIKKKTSTLHQENRKDALKASESEGYERVTFI